MRYVRLLSIVACVATFGLILQTEVPSVMADDRPDIGLIEPCPEDKGDILVVYSATWCGPCQAMRPQWTLLRSQGYKVVYVDIDNPHKYDGRWEYQTAEIVEKALEKTPRAVPTVRYYNSYTGAFLKNQKTGYQSLESVKEALWKPSYSKALVPERRR